MGDASKIADYDSIKKRLMGSRYSMNFNSGVNFDMTVVTSDSTTAATVSSLLKGYMLFKKVNATPPEKVAVENTSIDSDGQNVQVRFKANDQQFQSLMHSDLFAAVTH
jgi:type IV secretory pathway protease TraF